MEYAIETFDLTKKFIQVGRLTDYLYPARKKEVNALNGVSFKIKKGELFGILGPNGAGKTTLIKILCTLILPTTGTALINGFDICKEGENAKSSIGLVTGDERSFYWRLTGMQNLRFFASLLNFSSSDADKKIEEVLDFVGMKDKADDRFNSYSTGMKQKMAIARGLLNNPDILFMDEPTRSLDPTTSQNLRGFVKDKLVIDQKKTVVLSTHHLMEAEQMCDRVAMINKGKISACGTIQELRRLTEREKMYIVTVKDLSEDTIERLNNLDGVMDLEMQRMHDLTSLELRLSAEKVPLQDVIEMIIDGGGKIYDCSSKEMDLGDIFAHLIDGEGGVS
ncbi:MAG: ABC transporter ATP-binding protein [Halobacteriota archaeon]|nr:ABC transporter ATP-binding protein [Halobacteriota archaeon]